MNGFKRVGAAWLGLALILTACSEDEYVYPSVVTEIVDLKTDEAGTGRSLLTDEGKEWALESVEGLDGLVGDSLYRVVTLYEPLSASFGKGTAKLYSIQQITSPKPLPEAKFKQPKTDPVKLQSLWRSGHYLNLAVQVLAKEQLHSFHFIENRIAVAETGERTLYLTLYHDRRGDIEGFYRKVYLSVPLWAYEGRLQPGDRIVFRLNTYEQGMIERTFMY